MDAVGADLWQDVAMTPLFLHLGLFACSTARIPEGAPQAQGRLSAEAVGGTTLTRRVKLVASDALPADNFGARVSGAGDIDGDGFADILVAASNELGGLGGFYVYQGGADGIDLGSELRLRELEDSYGTDHVAVAGAGDVDGDGYDDVVLGDWMAEPGLVHAGAIFVYWGGPDSLSPDSVQRVVASDKEMSDKLGCSVAGAGDLDGDGYADLIVGATGVADEGAAYAYYGSASGVDGSREDKLEVDGLDSSTSFGNSVAGAGDTDGDGLSDVVVGAMNSYGSAFVYSGTGRGIEWTPQAELEASDGFAGDAFADSVDGAGDVDGDGYDDVVVGAPGKDLVGDRSGAAYVYRGSSDGIDPDTEVQLVQADAADQDWLGRNVAGAGDVDGDGYDDLIIGAHGANEQKGAAYLFVGGPDGPTTDSQLRLVPAHGVGGFYGSGVAGAGDVDGDGYDDVLVGAQRDNQADRLAGAVHLHFGG